MATENIDPSEYRRVLDSLYGQDTYNAWERQRTIQGQVIGQMKQFGQGTWDAGESAKNFGKSISISLEKFNTKLALVGKAFEALGVTVGAALTQNKKLLDDYRRLSDSGNLMIGGFDELNDSLNKVGLAAGEADKLIYALAPATKELTAFGGSVSSGRKKLLETMSGLIGYGNQYETQLRRLGYTQDQIREGTSQYIALQTQMGLSQGKTAAQLSKESFNYMTTLKELQELTGMSRDEAAKEIAEQQRQLRVKMYLADIEDETTRKNTSAMIAYVKNTMGPEAAKGYIDMLLNKGAAYTPESIALQRTMPGIYRESQDAIKKGTGSFVPMMVRLSKQAQGVVNQFGKQQFMIQEGNLRGVLAYDALTASYKFSSMTEEQTKAIAEMTAATKTSSEGLDNANELERMQRRNKLLLDEALYKTTQSVITGFVKMVKTTDTFTEKIAKLTDAVTRRYAGESTFLNIKPTNLLEKHYVEAAKEREKQSDYTDKIIPVENEINSINQKLMSEQHKMTPEEVKESQKRLKELLELEKSINESAGKKSWLDRFKERFTGPSPILNQSQQPGNQSQQPGNQSPQTRSLSSGQNNEQLTNILRFPDSGSGTQENFNKLNSSLRQSVISAAKEYNQLTGNKLQINSAVRSSEDQQRLWDESVKAGRPGKGPTGMDIAKPGTSKHERGLAVDIQNYNDPDVLAILMKHGLHQPLGARDPVHFELQAALGGLFSGPNSGYPVMLHGKNESVWNEKQIQGLVNDVKQTSIESYKQELISKNVTNNSFGGDSSMIVSDIMKVLTDRLDEVVSNLSRGNRIQEEILVQAKI